MQNFVRDMLHDSSPATRMLDLWQVIDYYLSFVEISDLTQQEYEEGQTDEAKFVKGTRWIFFSSTS